MRDSEKTARRLVVECVLRAGLSGALTGAVVVLTARTPAWSPVFGSDLADALVAAWDIILAVGWFMSAQAGAYELSKRPWHEPVERIIARVARVVAGLGLLLLLLPSPALAGHLTELDGERAVAFGGRTWTWEQLQARRDLAPARFDHFHPRLGWALSHEAELTARREIDSARFDRRHPYLGWLLAGEGTAAPPCLPVKPPTGPPEPPGPIHAVPEPPGVIIATTGLLGAFLGMAGRRGRNGNDPNGIAAALAQLPEPAR